MIETTRCEICDRTFKDVNGLAMHNSAKHQELIPKQKNPLPIKKIRNWSIFIVIIALAVWGIAGLANNNAGERIIINEGELNFEAPKGAIHWHPHLTIKIDGVTIPIPKDVGITSSAHYPMHTHETDGTIHMENNRPTKKTVVLGYFFEVWEKKFSKDCLFQYCTDKGELKMYVNGKENLEFGNYFMKDGDNILIEYTSGIK